MQFLHLFFFLFPFTLGGFIVFFHGVRFLGFFFFFFFFFFTGFDEFGYWGLKGKKRKKVKATPSDKYGAHKQLKNIE